MVLRKASVHVRRVCVSSFSLVFRCEYYYSLAKRPSSRLLQHQILTIECLKVAVFKVILIRIPIS